MSKNSGEAQQWVVVGKVVSAFGVKGWLKIRSFTQDEDDLFHYKPWTLRPLDGEAIPETQWQKVSLDQYRKHGKGYVACLDGCIDRNEAELLRGFDIVVSKASLPIAGPDEVYWTDLEGLQVVNLQGETLGIVEKLMETGANDVLSVKPSGLSIDEYERLIPYVDHVIDKIDLEKGLLVIDWHVDY